MRIIITAILAGLVAGSLEDGTAAPAGSGPADEGIIRYYDLSSLRFEEDDDEFGSNQSLVPFNPHIDRLGEVMDIEDVGYCEVELELIMEVLYKAIGEEHFEHNGALMELTDLGLRVKGSEEMHGTVSHILDFMAAHLKRRIALDIEVFSLENGTSVDITTTDSGLTPILKTTLQGEIGDLMEFSSGVERPIVWDFDPEIAQAAVVSESNVDSLFIGLDFAVRPLIAADGKQIIVVLYARSSSLTQPVMTRDLKNMARLAHQQGVVELAAAQSLDDPRIEFAGMAGTVMAEPGKPAVVQACFPHLNGMGSLVVSVTPRLQPAPAAIELQDGLVLSTCDLSHLQADHLLPFKPLSKGLYRHMGFQHFSEYNEHDDSTLTYMGPPLRTCFLGSLNIVERLMDEEFFPGSGDEEDEIGQEVFFIGDAVFLLSRPEQNREFQERVKGMFLSTAAAVDVDLRFVEIDGPALSKNAADVMGRGTLQGMTALPLIHGGRAASIAGFEGLAVDSYSVEVANNAAIANPIIARFVDGAHIQVRHEPDSSSSRSGTIAATVLINRLTGPIQSRNLGDRGGLLGIVDQPNFDQGFMDTRFDVDGNPHILGSVSGVRDGVLKTLYVIGKARMR